jgi:hypothetical protein
MRQARTLLLAALVVTGLLVGLGAVAGVAAADGGTSWTYTVGGTEQTATFEGAGTAADPFIIDSIVDLQAINKNSTTRSKHYALEADIDAEATKTWDGGKGFVPLTTFTGNLDGAGNAVVDLHIDRSGRDQVGLFGRVGSGERRCRRTQRCRRTRR